MYSNCLFYWSCLYLSINLSMIISLYSACLYGRKSKGRIIIHWVSKETYYFFRVTLIILQSIKMNIWIQIRYSTPYQAHLKKQHSFESKRSKMQWNWKSPVLKITKTAHLLGLEFSTDKKRLHNRPLKLNERHWMFWIGGILWIFSASKFCDFWMTFCNFIDFFSFLTKALLWYFSGVHKEYSSLFVSKYD